MTAARVSYYLPPSTQRKGEGMIIGMKISVNTPDDLVGFVDQQVHAGLFASRSAAFADALRLWRLARLESSYDEAFAELDDEWDVVVADGLAERDVTA